MQWRSMLRGGRGDDSPNRISMMATGLTIVGAALLAVLAGLSLVADSPGRPEASAFSGDDARKLLATGHLVGDSTAPVILTVFFSYSCAFSKAYQRTLDSLLSRHPKEVAVVYVPFTGGLSVMPSDLTIAAECAAKQNKFASFHRNVALLQRTDYSAWQLALASGISDTTEFRRCSTTEELTHAISLRSMAASSLGISATPTTVVSGRIIRGQQNLDRLESLVALALAAKPK
jgi:protein-disulfide isomerase